MSEFERDLRNLLRAKGEATHQGIAANLHGTSYNRGRARKAEGKYEDELANFIDKWRPKAELYKKF